MFFPQMIGISFHFSPLSLFHIHSLPSIHLKSSPNKSFVLSPTNNNEIYKKPIKATIKWINRSILWTTILNCAKVPPFFLHSYCMLRVFQPILLRNFTWLAVCKRCYNHVASFILYKEEIVVHFINTNGGRVMNIIWISGKKELLIHSTWV